MHLKKQFISNACDKGESEEFVEDNDEFVDTEYAAGSMVWAKMKGYPWWPALVDFCPDTDEYYWLDSWNEENVGKTPEAGCRPTWYHVVFFDIPHVKRAWIRVADIFKFHDIKTPPKAVTNIKPGLKIKWKKILSMAADCFELGREERLEKYSFAALFDGEWGYYDETTNINKLKKNGANVDIDKKEDSEAVDQIAELKPSSLLHLWNNNIVSDKLSFDDWTCDMCLKKFPYVENIVFNHLQFHHLTIKVSY